MEQEINVDKESLSKQTEQLRNLETEINSVNTKIDSYLKKGMVEIPDGSKFYLNCEKCGCEIRYGRYCPECAKSEVVNNLRSSYQDVGERPKQRYNPEMSGKMHFINRGGN